MAYKVFVDGATGTTGLRIHKRLAMRDDVILIMLPEKEQKNLSSKVEAVHQADVSILCLPDDAAQEIVQACNNNAKICDTSTAHRTATGWVYGFAELQDKRKEIQNATRVAVPGCHASGFLALIAPLTEREILPINTSIFCHSITGYSGGGKAMISAYTSKERPKSYDVPREYSLGMAHKHLPEMKKIANLQNVPFFTPIVADYYSGMLVSIPLSTKLLPNTYQSPAALANFYKEYYKNEPLFSICTQDDLPEDGTLSACALSGKDCMQINISGNEEQILLTAQFDNLGKGASGAAIQCMNILLGCEETKGLIF